jgi:hypothetical protein
MGDIYGETTGCSIDFKNASVSFKDVFEQVD